MSGLPAESLINRIAKDEGFSATPYRCPAGRLTIGYGRNLEAKGISEPWARAWLIEDVQEATADLQRLFGATYWAQLDDVRRFALINMRFQLGGGGFRSFKRMIAALRLCSWSEAGAEIFNSRYARQTPGRAYRIAYEIIDGFGG